MKYYLPYAKRVLLIFSLLLLFSTNHVSLIKADTSIYGTIAFYNPQSNINNFSALKINFDTYLSTVSEFKFHPFNTRESFEDFAQKNLNSWFLISGWHYKTLSKQMVLQPIMIGLSNSKATQTMVILSKSSKKDVSHFNGKKKIASAANKDFTRQLVSQIFGPLAADNVIGSFNILPVPKDIDALMAVGSGLAGMSLTTKDNFEKLQFINKKLYKSLNIIGESDEMTRIIVAAADTNMNTSEQKSQLSKIFDNMSTNHTGETALKMIGLDSWRKISDNEIEILQKK